MNKIKKLSKIIISVLYAALCGIPIGTAITWWQNSAALTIPGYIAGSKHTLFTFIPAGLQILHPLTANNRLMGFIICLLPVAAILLAIYFTIKLFSLYKAGNIFNLQNAKYIKYIASIILIWEVILNPIYSLLLSITLTYQNPEGKGYAVISYSGIDFLLIFVAIIILCISLVMAEAAKLSEDQKRII